MSKWLTSYLYCARKRIKPAWRVLSQFLAEINTACADARSATLAYIEAAERDEASDVMSRLFDRERLALECVAALKARSARGISEKAALLADYARALDGSQPMPELVTIAW